MRKIKNLILTFLLMLVAAINVNAKTIYTAYKAGDEIEVNVSDTDKIKFYVVEDSSAENSTVEAIMDGTSYPTKTTYDNINSTLSNYTSGWTNVTKVSIPSMQKLIGIDASTLSESDKFTSPEYAIPVASYWLSDSGQLKDTVGHWVIGSTLNDEGTYGVYNDTQEVTIRPLIKVLKEHVVGGSYVKEEEITVKLEIPDDAHIYNGHSYYIYSNVSSGKEAQNFCKTRGAYLAAITSLEENEAVYSFLKNQEYESVFFGFSDVEEEGIWKWVSGEQSNYTNWHSGEPNSENSNEDYAMYYHKFKDGTWNDGNFNDKSLFICEWNFEDSLWDKFVEKFKNTELVKMYDDSDAELKIESTDNTLNVTLTNEGKTFTTKFIYEKGILKYESDSKKDELIFADSMWQMNALLALSELKGYNINRVSKWLEENEDKVLTIENDGIEYVSKDYHYEEEKEGVSTNIDATLLTSFMLDIKNGLKSYKEELISIYSFIFGKNQKYKFNETKELKFEVDGEYSDFDNIHINDKLLASENYTVSEGNESTVIVLKQSYLDALNNGTHTIKVNYKDGEFAETTFTVEKTVKNPSTGIGVTYGILILALVFGGIYLLARKQSKFPKHD